MKKIKFSFILVPILFGAALTWYACQKETIPLPNEQSPPSNCNNSSIAFSKKKPPEPTTTKRRKKLKVAVNDWGLVWQYAMDNEIAAGGTAGSNTAISLIVPLIF